MKAKQNNQKVIMWYKVRELFERGFNKSQISRELGMDRGTVIKYLGMSEDEFFGWINKPCCMPVKLQSYHDYVKSLLEAHPYLSSSQVEDRLKENYQDLPQVHSKTVHNFVQRVRSAEGIKKRRDQSPRVYQKLPETDYGHQAQADFGKYRMQTKGGGFKDVHFFVMVLCRSRFKFVYFQDKPFTSKDTVLAHEECFKHFKGQPAEVVYDQDRVLIVDENLGDILLTGEFRAYCNQSGFKPVFCRKSDPESKGKVENVVGFVKKNFLRGRAYEGIDSLNASALGWLERTGNGKEHAGIKKIPRQEWLVEQPLLKPLKQAPPGVPEKKRYRVRKDNTVSYRGNFYTLPLGTYTGADTWVLLDEAGGELRLYATAGELLTTHPAGTSRGATIRNSDHLRDKSESLPALMESVGKILPPGERTAAFLDNLRADKPRYFRDNLLVIKERGAGIGAEYLSPAIDMCIEGGIYNSYRLIEIAGNIKKSQERGAAGEVDVPRLKMQDKREIMGITVKTSQINTYQTIME
jgi:transposase